MCGINGLFRYTGPVAPDDRRELIRTRDYMSARGPDGFGEYWDAEGRLGFGHRRLAIIDLSERGQQPMASVDGATVITFNGEIYNFRELRAELAQAGVTMHSDTDTEVLLHLYRRDGAAMLPKLRGMFTFGIWDAAKQGLLIARDPYGIKPLYTSDTGGVFRFASQVKALLAGGQMSREPDPAGVTGFFLWGSVPDPFTLYRDVAALPAGSSQWIDRGGARAPVAYCSLPAILAVRDTPRPSPEAIRAEVRAAVVDSVRAHLIADVDVGLFLSSGIDSTALLGLIHDTGRSRVKAVTLAFEEFRGTAIDEAPLAAKSAARYGAEHIIRYCDRAEFDERLPDILDAMDQPSIDGVNTWLVSMAAKEAGMKVALSGVGADELLAGYGSFAEIPRWVRLMRLPAKLPALGMMARKLMSLAGGSTLPPKLCGMAEYGGTYPGAYLLRRGLFLPFELGAVLDDAVIEAGLARLMPLQRLRQDALVPMPVAAVSRVSALESCQYMRNQLLRDSDWAGMAHSIEIRTPFVDIALLERLAPLVPWLGDGVGKAALATAPATALPDEIAKRPKTGFSVPTGRWLANGTTTKVGSASRAWAKQVFARSYGESDAATAPAFARKPVKVLGLIPDGYGGYGGIARYNQDFAEVLGHWDRVSEVVLLPRIAPEPFAPPGGKITQLFPSHGRLRYSLRALRIALSLRPDIIFCGHLYHSVLTRYLARLVGARVVCQIHGVEAWRELPRQTIRALRATDIILCVSADTRRRLVDQEPRLAAICAIVPNTVGAAFTPGDRGTARDRFDVGDDFVILSVGRLDADEAYKGHDRIMPLLGDLETDGRRARYIIAGKGSGRAHLEQLAVDYGVADRVRFLDEVSPDALPDLYRAADLFALPSTGEGFGIVFIEAMACGTLAIGLDVGGAGDALCDGELGIASSIEDFPQALARAVVLAGRQSDGDRVALAERVRARFGQAAFETKIRAVLEPVLDRVE
jgi:asparagine synthase (glutamine-hydrolysing)